MPPTRREQLELDELLSDIYLGIETLPDKSAYTTGNNLSSSSSSAAPANSSSNHRQHIYDLNSKGSHQHRGSDFETRQQDKQPAQSLASFVTSTPPPTTTNSTNTARRVRIVEPPDKRAKQQPANNTTTTNQPSEQSNNERRPVKYINTNKLIYHQERNPDDKVAGTGDAADDDEADYNDQAYSDDDIDDLDGVTRVEYYHTTWLDRQLGRASKRRSSKELNERQVKEKAMIEELKRNLKNGAITLRQSFKGNKRNNRKSNEIFDDQYLIDSGHKHNNNLKQHGSNNSKVVVCGLATAPRHHKITVERPRKSEVKSVSSSYSTYSSKQGSDRGKPQTDTSKLETTSSINSNTQVAATPKQTAPISSSATSDYSKTLNSRSSNSNNLTPTMQTKHQEISNYSRTLPHNYSSGSPRQHQLLQSHYRGGGTLNRSPTINTQQQQPQPHHQYQSSTLRNTMVDNNCRPSYGTMPSRSPNTNRANNMQQQQQNYQPAETISSIPSATEVVRQALSRSSSQISLNQMNKTINLLPNSPSPYPNPSPVTPTQNLRAATPSLSPSPVQNNCRSPHQHRVEFNTSGNTHQHQHQTKPMQQQPVYANPHAALMQQRQDEQMRKSASSNRNNASIREFNELDSLLRSLSPNSISASANRQQQQRITTSGGNFSSNIGSQITPAFSSKPAQPSFGYGFSQPAPANQQPVANNNAIYARVQKQPTYNQNIDQTKASYLQQNYLQANNIQRDAFTIDATNEKKQDCLQSQNLSEFEPPVELIPSMEDYQNISKLNPVKNHYWYKPNMSRERAIDLLKNKPQGTFIVRDSTSFRGAFGLAVKVAKLPKNVLENANLRNSSDPSSDLIRHFLIEPTSSGVRLKGYANEPIFGSLPALIYQHSLVELALPCKLVIPRADIEDPMFNYKQKQFYDEFLVSREQAKHAPYADITSPNGGYRKYPGDVYVHNEHRIIFE